MNWVDILLSPISTTLATFDSQVATNIGFITISTLASPPPGGTPRQVLLTNSATPLTNLYCLIDDLTLQPLSLPAT